MKLSEAKAQRVWSFFQDICRIPRPSKHEEKIIAWLCNYAADKNWQYHKDQAGNIIVNIPASSRLEDRPAIILQSHVDMVCEKLPEKQHDFLQDPIEIVEKDGWIYADGTTLGADNGIGVALTLALAQEDIPHPALELLFTVDEETGLTGANELPADVLRGKYLLNLDSEDEGVFTLGCAGGEQTDLELPVTWEKPAPGLQPYRLVVSGLQGGHSGVNINQQRGNAIKILAAVLLDLGGRYPVRLAAINGGRAHNAIPRDAWAAIFLSPADVPAVRARLAEIAASLKKDLTHTDPDIALELASSPAAPDARLLSEQTAQTLTRLLVALPHGVERYSAEIEGLVETSTNLAKVEIRPDKSSVYIITSQRSSQVTGLERITRMVHAIALLAHAKIITSGRYPAWEPKWDSSLLQQCVTVYTRLFHKEPVQEIIHAGLECGIIGAKYPGMEMISLGPTIENPHSPQERINIESVDKLWLFLLELLPALQ